jgi:pyridoxamine 5'-phosphate oxidase
MAETEKDRRALPLREADVDADPLAQLERWLTEATDAGAPMPEAIALATATPDGLPSARMVLLKGFDERGFVFYTGYGSRKGRELADNPRAALLAYWHELGRQVRIEGTVEALAREDSERYFAGRPRGSQLAAWASEQSRPVPGREHLEQRFEEARARFAGGEVPLPAAWGGYRLRPESIELWQHRADRLHDRLRYRRAGEGWVLERLAP